MNTTPKYNLYLSLPNTLKQLKIKPGSIVLFSSDLTAFLYKYAQTHNIANFEEKTLFFNGLIDTITEYIGPDGTLLIPSFTWAFCKRKKFDIRSTRSTVGTLSNWILTKRPDFRRTQHPMYSFLVKGNDADFLCEMTNQDAWGPCSPFQYLHDNNAKQILFNIEAHQGMTYCHYVEQAINVPYRYPKYFFSEYIDAVGNSETRMYSMWVREPGAAYDLSITNDFLIKNNVAINTNWNDNDITSVDLASSFAVIESDLKDNGGRNCVNTENGVVNWGNRTNRRFEIGGLSDTPMVY